MNASFPVSLLISTEQGLVPLDRRIERIPVPRGLSPSGIVLHYGPYLRSLEHFLTSSHHEALCTSLSSHLGRSVGPHEVRSLEIISEKHGAYYHVARVCVTLLETVCHLCINVAVTEPQHAALEREFQTLLKLGNRFPHHHLPHAYYLGEIPLSDHSPGTLLETRLKLAVLEWFEGYLEFHLSRENRSGRPALRLWETDQRGAYLSRAESQSVYQRASHILTSYLDADSFAQIFPWHHGAGDFVVRLSPEEPDVKLITARDYRTLASWGEGGPNPWLGALHFFYGLTIRMRLDRLDGTGPLAWAPYQSLSGVIKGFFTAWDEKSRGNPLLPPPERLLHLFRGMSREEWLAFAEVSLQDFLVEGKETPFARHRMGQHAADLVASLQEYRPDEPSPS
ncbi:MAG: hypothetical protein GX443_18395 [Deltaproteobacteria bacterium]|nr:hypothetical protein [Deltaproteobacteria bacterium]